MTVREAWKLQVPVHGAWLIGTLGFCSWLAFTDDRPYIGGYLLLIVACVLADYVSAFATRRIEELQAKLNDGSVPGLCPFCGCPADAPVACARPFHDALIDGR